MIADPLKSVVDFSFYRDIPKKSLGATVGYIAYLGLIYSCAVVLSLVIHFKPRVEESVEWASQNIPPMTLMDGKLTSSRRGETVVRHPSVPEMVVVIDTDRTSAVTPAEMAERKAFAFLTQNTIFVYNNERMEAYDISKAQNKEPVEIDGEFYQSIGSIMNMVLFPAAFATSWFIFFIWKHAAALIYTLLALLINAGVGGGLEFQDLYKIAVYAQTPVVVLQMVALVLLKSIPFFQLLAVIVVGVYLWQGIRQNRVKPDPEEAV